MPTAAPDRIDPADVARRFARDGFAVVPGVLAPDELAALRANSAELILRGRPAAAAHPDDWFIDPGADGAPEFHRVQNLFDKRPIDDAFLVLLGHPSLLALVRRLLGDRFLCTGDALVFKLPGNGREVALHADCDVADPRLRDEHRFFNLDIYLDDATPEGGCLLAAAGTHRDRAWPRTHGHLGLDWPALAPLPVRAGDVIVHDTRVAHGSRRSSAPALRRTIYFEFHALDDVLAERGPRPGLGCPDSWVVARARLIEAAIAARAARAWAVGEAQFAYRLPSALGLPPLARGEAIDLRPTLGVDRYF